MEKTSENLPILVGVCPYYHSRCARAAFNSSREKEREGGREREISERGNDRARRIDQVSRQEKSGNLVVIV